MVFKDAVRLAIETYCQEVCSNYYLDDTVPHFFWIRDKQYHMVSFTVEYDDLGGITYFSCAEQGDRLLFLELMQIIYRLLKKNIIRS